MHYLVVSARLAKKAPQPPADPLPKRLSRVAALQQEDGRWLPSDELKALLGGAIPDPPDGVSDWRWMTCLVVAFLRRFPEDFDALLDYLEKAAEWVGDPHLMAKAKKALPPLQKFVRKLDPASVRRGEWQKEAAEQWEKKGFKPFLPDTREMRTLGGTGSASADELPKLRRRPPPIKPPPTTPSERPASTATRPTSRAKTPGSLTGFRMFDSGEHFGDVNTLLTPGALDRAGTQGSRGGSRPQTTASEGAKSKGSEGPDVNKLLGLVDDTPDPKEVARRRRKKRELEAQRKGLALEWKQFSKAEEHPFRHGEVVKVAWRRPSRWRSARPSKTLHTATIARANADGTVDVTFTDLWREREFHIKREYIKRRGEKGFDVDEDGNRIRADYKKSIAEKLRERWEDVPTLRREKRHYKKLHDEVYGPPDWEVRMPAGEPKPLEAVAAAAAQFLGSNETEKRAAGGGGAGGEHQMPRGASPIRSERLGATGRRRKREKRSAGEEARQEEAERALRTEQMAKEVLNELTTDPSALSRLPGVRDDHEHESLVSIARRIEEEKMAESSAEAGKDAADDVDAKDEVATRDDTGVDVDRGAAADATGTDGGDAAASTPRSWSVDGRDRATAGAEDPLSQEVVQAILAYEKTCTDLLRATLKGAHDWRTVRTNQEQLKAFDGTTAGIRECRELALQLVEIVQRWQRREIAAGRVLTGPAAIVREEHYFDKGPVFNGVGDIEKLPDWPGAAAVELTRMAMSKEEFEGDPDDRFSGAEMKSRMKGPHRLPKPTLDPGRYPPPFKWNGENILAKIGRSLDFLQGVPELDEWYTDAFPRLRNPFGMNLCIDERPPTPRPKGRMVKKDNEDMFQEFARNLAEAEWDERVCADYEERLQGKTAEWWPSVGISAKDRARIREAERALLIAEASVKDARAVRDAPLPSGKARRVRRR